MSLRVIHISYTYAGGAGRAGFRLAEAQSNAGMDVKFLTFLKESNPSPLFVNWPEGLKTNALAEDYSLFRNQQILQNRSSISNTFFSLSHPSVDLLQHFDIRNADIIHLHWVAGCVSPEQIYHLARARKKVFWTLHDTWGFSGGCHYPAGCTKYESSCDSCPQLLSDPLGISSKSLTEKKLGLAGLPLTLVGPSQWIANCARKSAVFGQHRVLNIPNLLDLDRFCPHFDKANAKAKLQMNPAKTWLLFGADDSTELRKGSHVLLQVLRRIGDWRDRVGIVGFGHSQEFLESLPFEKKFMGFINSDELIARVYQACDILLLPSLEDNLPNLMLESLACGTPVVSFPVGGMQEHIHGLNGTLSQSLRTEDYEHALRKQLLKLREHPESPESCRQYVQQTFAPDRIVAAYFSAYRQALASPNEVSQRQVLTDSGYLTHLVGGWAALARLRWFYLFSIRIPRTYFRLKEDFRVFARRIKRKLKGHVTAI